MSDTRVRLNRSVYDRFVQVRKIPTMNEQVRVTGIPRRTLYRVLNGHPPSLTTAMRMADTLGMPLDVLFERVEAD